MACSNGDSDDDGEGEKVEVGDVSEDEQAVVLRSWNHHSPKNEE